MKYSKLHGILCHATIIMGLMFVIFFVIDRFNPAMEFIGSEISDWLLGAFSATAVISSVMTAIKLQSNANDTKK